MRDVYTQGSGRHPSEDVVQRKRPYFPMLLCNRHTLHLKMNQWRIDPGHGTDDTCPYSQYYRNGVSEGCFPARCLNQLQRSNA